ncbi:MAG: DUF4234 domain-containing protein [Oscillospiraceae bacterium]|nr:DUF4234 domain-containing protein [Oscillospiraceae bacterium]
MDQNQQNQQYYQPGPPYIGKTRDPVMVIVLSLVTCGIYYFYWLYTTMNDLNQMAGREILSPGKFLLLSIFCAPAVYYVFYTVDRSLAEVSRYEGTAYKENFIMWLILAMVCGVGLMVGMHNITEGFNNIWASRAARFGNTGANPDQNPGGY